MLLRHRLVASLFLCFRSLPSSVARSHGGSFL
jgi:hypothetical protein